MTYRGYRIVFGGLENGEALFLIHQDEELIYKTNTMGKSIELIDELLRQGDFFLRIEERKELWKVN